MITINVLDGNDLPPIFVPCNITNVTVEDCTNLTYSSTILERTVSIVNNLEMSVGCDKMGCVFWCVGVCVHLEVGCVC